MFDKYARAVGDKTERENLHKLYRIRNTLFICFMALCACVILEALLMKDGMRSGQMICFGLTLLCWIVTGVLSLSVWGKFRCKFREILARPKESDEDENVAAYRAQMRREQKSARWALWVMIACLAAMLALVVTDALVYDADKFHVYAYVGICVAVAGVLVYFFALLRANMRKAMQTNEDAPDVQKIDASQGRATAYRLQDDKNLQSYRYLLPTPALRARAEQARRKIGKATLISLGVSVVLIFVLFSQWGVCPQARGYAFPLFLGLTYGLVFFSVLPFSCRLRAVDQEQKRILEQTPAYEKHLAIYRKYERFGKGKGRILHVCLLLGFAVSLVLAILLPRTLWSGASCVVIVAGLYLNNFFTARLRKETLPLEAEIDAAPAASSEEKSESSDN